MLTTEVLKASLATNGNRNLTSIDAYQAVPPIMRHVEYWSNMTQKATS